MEVAVENVDGMRHIPCLTTAYYPVYESKEHPPQILRPEESSTLFVDHRDDGVCRIRINNLLVDLTINGPQRRPRYPNPGCLIHSQVFGVPDAPNAVPQPNSPVREDAFLALAADFRRNSPVPLDVSQALASQALTPVPPTPSVYFVSSDGEMESSD